MKNQAYLVVILLSRVIVRLGGIDPITPKTIESLYATDLNFLQNLYNQINRVDEAQAQTVCPQCQHEFALEAVAPGGF